MITNFFIPKLNNHDVQKLWFQQDGATCRTARAIIDLLKDSFGDHLISCFGSVNWPPRSCDITPLDYFLWISRFGVPLQLHSDQGWKFESAIFKRLCEILADDKTRTTALHPQSDGMAESFNRTILNSLSLLVSSNQQDWDKKLPFFLLAYMSAVHKTTGYSPSQMLFGRHLCLPADLLLSQPPDTPLAPKEYIKKLQARMEEMHHLLQGNWMAFEK
ncbi:retrovirus-related Pol polyprotein from transposon 412 [Trichonephila clavipes]|nr:retrovirus-related Pol polyprotein from transposon 412 [Trichonephila clavipes]